MPSSGPPTQGDGLLINIGTGVETSVNDLYATMARVAGVDRAATFAPARARGAGSLRRSMPPAPRCSSGWRPWTDLAVGSAAVLDYFRSKAT
jgi:UDP-glucose 4-epimerase